MNRNWRAAFYIAAGAALIVALLAAPGVWATPGQSDLNQTVPTRTPETPPQPPEPAPPTPEPPPATQPPDPASTAAPTATAGPTATRTGVPQRSPLGLTIVADRAQVWPGATVSFTLTVTNQGTAALQQVQVADVLAEGLEPGEIVSGDATWDGETLRVTVAELAAGARLAIVYTARVIATVPGEAIVTRATASAAGGAQASATLTLGLPPSELPATGGCLAP